MSIISAPKHEISIVVDGQQIKGWESYEIRTSMLEPANHFTMRMPFSFPAWDLCKTDRPVKVLVDNVVVLSGWIDERLIPEDDESVEIVGRSRLGRLVQESAPGIDFANSDVFTLVKQVAAPWFTAANVTFSNAKNRTVLRGRGKKAKAYDRPLTLATRKAVGTHIQPGMTRMEVINALTAQAGYLAWESGDGTQLIVGEPNYDQEIQFRFFKPKAGSTRGAESTVIGMGVRESTADRYSRMIVVGSGQGTDANYGAAVASRYAEIKDNPDTPEGDGLDFSAPKRLVQQRAVQSIDEATDLVVREALRRDIAKQRMTVIASAHGQNIGGAYTTIFTYDTLASCEDERTGLKDTFYIVGVTYRSNRKDGETSLIELIPKNTRLVSS